MSRQHASDSYDFPTDVERLRRAIEADRSLSYRDRILTLNGIWNTVDLIAATAIELPARNRLRELRNKKDIGAFVNSSSDNPSVNTPIQ
jgi:hypothetical protein